MVNISKFSWPEMFSNNNGKTSGSGVAGFVTVMVGLLGFLAGIVLSYIAGKTGMGYDIILQSLGVVTLGSSLLGIRRLSSNGNVKIDNGDIASDNLDTTNPVIKIVESLTKTETKQESTKTETKQEAPKSEDAELPATQS
jgi:hypothetical protein